MQSTVDSTRGSGYAKMFGKKLSAVSLSRYDCREEFQIHDRILSAKYSVGKISDTLPEHYLVLVSIPVYFLKLFYQYYEKLGGYFNLIVIKW